MPTNVSPEYKKAQEQYRKAREPADRLKYLREMLSTIPKHKGTEALQADIKTKIKDMTEELVGGRKGGTRTGPVQVIKPEGAAQISLIGPPNAGKSSLHRALTGSRAEIGVYPFTTKAPLPGMLMYQDVPLQLIDLPPISAEFMEPWLPNALQPAHAALLVLDLHEPDCAENLMAIRERLDEKRITLTDQWPSRLPAGLVPHDWPRAGARGAGNGIPDSDMCAEAAGGTSARLADGIHVGAPCRLEESDAISPGVGTSGAPHANAAPPVPPGEVDDDKDIDDPFRITLPTLLILTKADLGFDPDEVDVLLELTGARFPAVSISAGQSSNLERLGALLMHGLQIVRVYTKIPGKPADHERPYTLFAGDTVEDLARLIHRDLVGSLRFGRVWGSTKFDGQQVGRNYQLADGDVVEIHA